MTLTIVRALQSLTASKGKTQKHPDVHNIVLSIKLRFPPRESVTFEGFILICTVFPHFGPFSGGGGGGKTKFCGQEFYGHPGFSEQSLTASKGKTLQAARACSHLGQKVLTKPMRSSCCCNYQALTKG